MLSVFSIVCSVGTIVLIFVNHLGHMRFVKHYEQFTAVHFKLVTRTLHWAGELTYHINPQHYPNRTPMNLIVDDMYRTLSVLGGELMAMHDPKHKCVVSEGGSSDKRCSEK